MTRRACILLAALSRTGKIGFLTFPPQWGQRIVWPANVTSMVLMQWGQESVHNMPLALGADGALGFSSAARTSSSQRGAGGVGVPAESGSSDSRTVLLSAAGLTGLGTNNRWPHFGQATLLPTVMPGDCRADLHVGQANRITGCILSGESRPEGIGRLEIVL
jgi:hypothetical protein